MSDKYIDFYLPQDVGNVILRNHRKINNIYMNLYLRWDCKNIKDFIQIFATISYIMKIVFVYENFSISDMHVRSH